MDLRKELPFGKYKPYLLNNRISVFKQEITVYIEECTKNPEFEGKNWNVLSLSHNSIEIDNREVIYNLNQVKFTLKFKDTEIKLDDLIKEMLKIKIILVNNLHLKSFLIHISHYLNHWQFSLTNNKS